ncbi:hypothetical protein LSTR_LSTR003418 [Laodelphax striatellus]|uniref:Uncharacterized protein n=1 Tax=Laodelphax striatellus TaxID=195883 RepID=A0A482X1K5_LAOST|nr:hypothetical protein LSTR_LSTR003418 [Laodelphax striatellus]
MESVLEKSSNAERLFHKHFKNRDNHENISDIIRKRLEIHPVSHLDHFKKLELPRSQEQKEVKKHSNQNSKFYNRNQTSSFNRVHDNEDVETNMVCRPNKNKEMTVRKKIDLLQNSRRIISAMANSQSIMSDNKLSKSDCVNYFKCNRTFVRDRDGKNQRVPNKFESCERDDSSIQSDMNNVCPKSSNKVEKVDSCIRYDDNQGQHGVYDSFDQKKTYFNSSLSKEESVIGKDAVLKNAVPSVKQLPSLENSKPNCLLKDESVIIQKSDGETFETNNSYENRIMIDPILCSENDKKIITEPVPVGDKICNKISIGFDEKSPSFGNDIQQVVRKPFLENSSDVSQEKVNHQNKELLVESVKALNLNNENEKQNNNTKISNTRSNEETLHDDKPREESHSLNSEQTSENIDKKERSNKPSEEISENSSEYLLDLMKFISGSKDQFSNLQKKLKIFGLHEEAKTLEVFSKSINQSLEQTMLDDVSLYLLGLQKRVLNYCLDNRSIGKQSNTIQNIITTTDNVLSVLDKYLVKPEINKNVTISKYFDECVTCSDSTHNTNEYSEDVSQEIDCRGKEDLIEGDEIEDTNCIDIEKNQLNTPNSLSNDVKGYDIEEFTKHSVSGIENDHNMRKINDQSEIVISNDRESLPQEGNTFVSGNDDALFNVDENGQILNNNLNRKTVSKYRNNLVGGLQSSTVESLSTHNNDKTLQDVDVKEHSNRDDNNREVFLNSEKCDNSLLLTEQRGSLIDESNDESKGPLKDSHKRELNLDPGRVSKLQNKKNLKAKPFLHPNYWKNHANSYHTVRGFPWVVGKKCLIENIKEADWKSKNNDILVTTEKSIEIQDSQDCGDRNGDVKQHGELARKLNLGNQGIRRFNTSSISNNFSNSGNKKCELKFLENSEYCKVKYSTSKRNYSTDQEETEIDLPKLERAKKKLSVRELFPEKKKPFIQTESKSEKEDIKLEVVGKKIIPQELPIEDERITQKEHERIREKYERISENVLVETAEEFLPSKSGISVDGVENFGKQTRTSDVFKGDGSEQFSKENERNLDKKLHEKTEEIILDGFGLSKSSSISENSAQTSKLETLNKDDSSERTKSYVGTSLELENHTEKVEDKNKPGKYDKAPIGFVQSPQNKHFHRSKENSKNFPNIRQRIDNYEEI